MDDYSNNGMPTPEKSFNTYMLFSRHILRRLLEVSSKLVMLSALSEPENGCATREMKNNVRAFQKREVRDVFTSGNDIKELYAPDLYYPVLDVAALFPSLGLSHLLMAMPFKGSSVYLASRGRAESGAGSLDHIAQGTDQPRGCHTDIGSK
eukprot:1185153-Prorocentrum_minimum.AAC.1